jgi:hypothetical protein
MPNRAKSFASALLGGVLIGGVFAASGPFSPSVTAFAAGECLESPNERTAQPGHWYYHFDRTLGRRCWFFQPSDGRSSEAKPSDVRSSEAPAAAAPSMNQDSQLSLLSRITAGFSPGIPFPPQQNLPPQAGSSDDAGDATRTSAKLARASRASKRDKERPQAEPAPVTSGAASASRHPDQPQQPASVAEKEEKTTAPVNVADREALFQDFMKWQMERSMFGRP